MICTLTSGKASFRILQREEFKLLLDRQQNHYMTHARFFQLSLCWPFIVWLLYLLFSSFKDHRGITFIVKGLYDSCPIFVPYALFAALVWRLAKGRSFRQLIMIAFIAPIVWGIFYVFSHMVQFYIKEHIVEGWFVLAVIFFWAAVVGYLIEIIPLAILVIFKDDFKSGQPVHNQ